MSNEKSNQDLLRGLINNNEVTSHITIEFKKVVGRSGQNMTVSVNASGGEIEAAILSLIMQLSKDAGVPTSEIMSSVLFQLIEREKSKE